MGIPIDRAARTIRAARLFITDDKLWSTINPNSATFFFLFTLIFEVLLFTLPRLSCRAFQPAKACFELLILNSRFWVAAMLIEASLFFLNIRILSSEDTPAAEHFI